MSPWSAMAMLAHDQYTVWVFGGIALVSILVRGLSPTESRRLGGIYVIFGLHLVLLIAAGILQARGAAAAREVRLLCLVFVVMAGIRSASTLVFGMLLPRLRLATPRILQDVVDAVASLITVFLVASRAGINLSGIIATSAVLTAVIGFALQDTLGNIIGGLALQLDRSMRVGDWIRVGDVSGRISDIRWRYTAIETRNWETVILPNSTLVKGQVMLLGRRTDAPLQWRRWIYFNIDFRHQPSEVIALVEEALRSAPIANVAVEPEPNCILMDLQESYGRYAARYWLTDLAVDDPTDSVVRTRICFALQRAGIPLSIPAHAIFLTEESAERKELKNREDLARRIDALRRIDLFARLADPELEELARSLRRAPFTRGEVLTRQGAEAHWLYMVMGGEVVVRVRTEEGLEREVARLGPGAFFGEMSLLTGEKRSATVVALSDVECYRLDKAAFQAILVHRPEVAESAAAILAERRGGLEAVRGDLDQEAQRRRLAADTVDLLARIRGFFGLGN